MHLEPDIWKTAGNTISQFWPKSGGTNNIGVPPLRILGGRVPPVFTPIVVYEINRLVPKWMTLTFV